MYHAESFTTTEDFYPRPPRGGRQAQKFPGEEAGQISIHALREEGDWNVRDQTDKTLEISIHAPGLVGAGVFYRP